MPFNKHSNCKYKIKLYFHPKRTTTFCVVLNWPVTLLLQDNILVFLWQYLNFVLLNYRMSKRTQTLKFLIKTLTSVQKLLLISLIILSCEQGQIERDCETQFGDFWWNCLELVQFPVTVRECPRSGPGPSECDTPCTPLATSEGGSHHWTRPFISFLIL